MMSSVSDNDFLEHVEGKGLDYIIALKQNAPLQKALIDAQGWSRLNQSVLPRRLRETVVTLEWPVSQIALSASLIKELMT